MSPRLLLSSSLGFDMAKGEKAIETFMDDASEAARNISQCISEDGFIHVVSHLDADGLAAAGILAKALWRVGAKFRVRIQQWVDNRIVSEIKSDDPDLTILADLGSGYLNILSENVSENKIIILDHHQIVGEASANVIQVNPHLHGIDGSRSISGSGVAYLVAKNMDDTCRNLAPIAIVGALGDIQDKYGQKSLGGLNEVIVADAISEGSIKVEKDLMFFGRETRPIHKALAYTTSPFLPGISGEEDKSVAFLQNLGINPKTGDKWRALRDLSEDEKQRLCSELSDHLVSKGYHVNATALVGSVYTLVNEEPWTPLRDAREFSLQLNATGRMGVAGLGVSICMGDRGAALDKAEKVLMEYRRTITEYLSWLTKTPDHIEEFEAIYVVRGENYINEKIIGTLSSILSTNLKKPDKPVIAYAMATEDTIKISARTVDMMTSKGLNLGEIMREAAEKFGGKGGGHDIAAGAQVKGKDIEAFLKMTDKLVQKRKEEFETES
jgi:RecJ-like exonuclease